MPTHQFAPRDLQHSRTRVGIADTLAEDEDLYRFLSDAEEYLRVPLV